MREIKFRGKCKWSGKWYYGYYSRHDNGPEGIEHVISYPGGYNNLIDPNSVGQYTGLKDKHGKDIYEGDILEAFGRNDFRMQVVYHPPGFSIKWFDEEIKSVRMLRDGTEPIPQNIYVTSEVIGNIYENPELLEQPNAN